MRCPERHMQVVSHQNEGFLKIMKIFFFSVDIVALASAWKMESARLARVPGVFFSSNRRDLDLEVDKTQLSL